MISLILIPLMTLHLSADNNPKSKFELNRLSSVNISAWHMLCSFEEESDSGGIFSRKTFIYCSCMTDYIRSETNSIPDVKNIKDLKSHKKCVQYTKSILESKQEIKINSVFEPKRLNSLTITQFAMKCDSWQCVCAIDFLRYKFYEASKNNVNLHKVNKYLFEEITDKWTSEALTMCL